MNGWVGKILRVDLSRLQYAIEEHESEKLGSYIGGRGFAAKIFSDEVSPPIGPFSTENKILFMAGPLTGTGALCSSGASVITKSPRHGGMAVSNLTGSLGLELKQAGFDGVIIEGRAREPVILEINDGSVFFKPAQSLWGKTTWQTEERLKRQVKNAWKADEYSILSIGPAGENRSPIASIIHNRFREGGQGGAGAVMGSKNLKAIMVWGNQPIEISDPKALRCTTQTALEKYKTLPVVPALLRNLGTASLVRIANELGVLPTKNFSKGSFGKAERICSEALAESIWRKPKACPTCPIACIRLAQAPGKKREIIEGPGYESLVFLGSALGISKIATIMDSMCLCLRQGLDIIAAGSALATGMEINEKGYTVDGLDSKLSFGKGGVFKVLKQMAIRKDDGTLLSKGGAALAEKAGHPECYMGNRGVETLIADPRGLSSLALFGATSNGGEESLSVSILAMLACDITNGLSMERSESRALFTKRMQDLIALSESFGLCPLVLLGIELQDIGAMATSVIGNSYDEESLLRVGERIWNMERSYNLRSGWQSRDDKLSVRFTEEPVPDGPNMGMVCDLSSDLPLYYEMRGWNEKGTPRSGKLKALGLDRLAEG